MHKLRIAGPAFRHVSKWGSERLSFNVHRPLAWLTLMYLSGAALESLRPEMTSQTGLIAGVSVLLIAVCVAPAVRLPVFKSFIIPMILFLGLGALSSRLSAPPFPAPSSLAPFLDKPQTLFLAEVTSPAEFPQDRIRLPLRLHRAYLDGKSYPVQGGALLTIRNPAPGPAIWLVGDRFLALLSLKPFHNFNNPGGYDYVRGQAERGLYARAQITDERSILRLAPEPESFPLAAAHSLGRRLESFRQTARSWLKNHLDPDTADFYGALLLGYRVPQDWAEHLSRTGVNHLLSISGLHLGLVSIVTFWIVCRLVRILCPTVLRRTSDQSIALWAALFAAILYALISGMALPTWRTMVMLGLSLGALMWQRSSDTLSALAAAALVILIINPNSLRQVSFQLSFAAVLGLLFLYPGFRDLQARLWDGPFFRNRHVQKLLRPFTEAFWVSLAANVATLPLVAYHFHGISLASFAANTVLVPAVGFLVLPLGLVSLAVYAVDERFALPILKLGAWFLGYCEQIILWFSSLSWAFFWVGNVPVSGLAAFYAGLALLLSSWSRRRKALGLSMLTFLFLGVTGLGNGPVGENDGKYLKVYAIDVGQGTSTLIQFPTGENALVDGGGFFDDSYDIGRSVLAPFLWHSGIQRLDWVVLSHDHPDHRNGLRFILSHFDVGAFWETGFTEPEKTDELSGIARRRQIPVYRLSEIIGEHEVAPCKVRVLHPNPEYIRNSWDRQDLNNVSLVLEISYGNTSVILPGDIDQSVEQLLFSDYPLMPGKKVLLFSPHHGSRGSNSSLMLDRLSPQAMVFSCGYENRFGFPAPRILAECETRHIPYCRTDLHGCIRAVSDGHQWRIRSQINNAVDSQSATMSEPSSVIPAKAGIQKILTQPGFPPSRE